MGLTELFNEWIVERGSAKVQEKHIALFRDQLAVADKRISELESENAVLKSQVSKFKSESDNLRIMNNELAAKIKKYENPQDNLLDETKEKILTLLSKHAHAIDESDIGSSIGLSPQAVRFHLEELAGTYMVLKSQNLMSGAPLWSLIQNGRRYLIERKLL